MGKYSDELAQQIYEKLENGCTKEQAAVLCGIVKDTFYDWVKTKPDFSDGVKHAIEVYKEKLITVVNAGTLKRPDIALEVLGRRFPEEWGEIRKLQLNDTQEQLSQMMRVILGKAQEGDIENVTDKSEPVSELPAGDSEGSAT